MAKIIKHEDLYEDNIFQPYMDSLKKAITETEKLKAILANDITSNNKTAKESSLDDYNNIQKKTKALNDGIKASNDLLVAEKQIAQATTLVKDALIKEEQARIKANLEKRESRRIAELQVKLNNEEAGSYNKLAAQHALNEKSLNSMSAEMRDTTEEGKRLKLETSALYAEMSRLKKETGKHQLEVGNYGVATKQVAKSVGELKKEIRALRNMSFVGKSTQEVAELKLKLGTLIDEMGDLQQEMKVLGGPGIGAVIGSLKTLSAGVEGVVGSLSLFGVESESVQKLEKKMIALIAVTHALSELEDVINSGKLKAYGIKLKSMALDLKDYLLKQRTLIITAATARAENAKNIAMAKGSIVTRSIAAAQWLWNAALMANPVGLILAGVVALTVGVYALTKALGSNNAENERANKNLQENNTKRKYAEAQDEYALNLAKARGMSDRVILELEKEMIKNKILSLELDIKQFKILQRNGEITDEQLVESSEKLLELIKLKGELNIKEIEINNNNKKISTEEKQRLKEINEKYAERQALLKQQQKELELFYLNTFKNIAKEEVATNEQRAESSKYLNESVINDVMATQAMYISITTKTYKKEREIALNEKGLSIYQRAKIEAEYIEKIRLLEKENNEFFISFDDKKTETIIANKEKILQSEQRIREFKNNEEIETIQDEINNSNKLLDAIEVNNNKEVELHEQKTNDILTLINKRLNAEIKSIDDEEKELKRLEQINENNANVLELIMLEADKKRKESRKKAIEEIDEMIQTAGIKTKEVIVKTEAEKNKELAESLEAASTIYEDYYNKRAEKEKESLNKQLEANKNHQNVLRELASKGVAGAAESLAFEIKAQAELELKQEKLKQKEKYMQLQMTALNTYAAKLQSGDKSPLGATIKDITLLSSFIKALPAFYDGTENTGPGGNLDDKGGFHAILHPNERVLTKMQNQELNGLNNWEVATAGKLYKENKINNGENNKELINKITQLTTIIDEKPVYLGRDYSATEKAIIDVVMEKNKVTRYHKKTNALC